MSTVPSLTQHHVPALYSGAWMKQAEFHRRYEAYPDDVKFELIGGIVYMASTLRRSHGRWHLKFGCASGSLCQCHSRRGSSGQCDDDFGGRQRAAAGPGSASIGRIRRALTRDRGRLCLRSARVDHRAGSQYALHRHAPKKAGLPSAPGVSEYVVLCIEELELHWFRFRPSGVLAPDADGVFRSRVFPGLWIDAPALLAGTRRACWRSSQGLASPQHAEFVRQLRSRRKKPG